MYRWLLGIITCLGIGVVASAQKCDRTVRVSVVETHNFKPVFPGLLHAENLDRSFETDEAGNVIIDSVCDGLLVLHFQAIGYQALVDTYIISSDQTIKLKVRLQDHTLQQVEVTGERVKTIMQAKENLDKDKLAANSGKSLGDLLQAVNGVSTLTNGANIVKPVIHGLHSNRIVMVNNGIRQEDQQWGGEHAPNIDPFLASNITVIKGAAGVRYGTDAIGGVVLVEPASLRNKPGWDGELNLAGFSNNRMGVISGMVEHGFKRVSGLSFRVQGTYKKGGNYRIPGYWVANTAVEETNYSAAVGYRKLHYGAEVFYSHFNTDLGIYRGSHTGNQADLDNAINSPCPLIPASFTYDLERPRQHVVHDLVKTRLYADTRAGMWNLTYGYQHNFRQEYDVLRKENGKAQLNLTLNTQTLNLNLDHKPVKGITGQVGIDGVYQDNFFRDGDRLFIPTYQSVGGAGYLIERYKHKSWNLEAGLRYDYRWYGVSNYEGTNQHLVYYEFNYQNMSGTLGFNQHITKNWHWSATLANAWRAPQASELFSAGLHHGAARVEIGNKDLQPERSYSLNLETKYTLGKLTADVSLYSQLINDFIYLEPGADLLTIRGYFKTFNYTQTNAWLNGADVSLHYQWNEHMESALKGAFLRAWDRTSNDWLILMPSDRVSFNSRYSTTLSPTFQDCFVGIDLKYVFEQTRIPRDFDSIDHPRPPKAYFLLDASVGSKLTFGDQPIYVSLAVTNLLNTRYRDYMDVFRYFIDQPGTNVVLRVRMPLEFIDHKKKN